MKCPNCEKPISTLPIMEVDHENVYGCVVCGWTGKIKTFNQGDSDTMSNPHPYGTSARHAHSEGNFFGCGCLPEKPKPKTIQLVIPTLDIMGTVELSATCSCGQRLVVSDEYETACQNCKAVYNIDIVVHCDISKMEAA
jgi:hypothetical protein